MTSPHHKCSLSFFIALTLCCASALAETGQVPGIVDGDINIKSRRVNAWKTENGNMLLIDGDARIAIGDYAFRARRGVVQIVTTTKDDQKITHMSAWLVDARSGDALQAVSGESAKLLVTGSATGDVNLKADALVRETPEDELVDEALKEFESKAPETPTAPSRKKANRILPANGVVSWNADDIVINLPDETREGNVVLIGDVRVVYQDATGSLAMSLQADNAVVFLKKSARASGNRAQATQVSGIYMEDNVIASNGQYTVRAPRVFYDTVLDKAALLNAVFYTWDIKRNIPVYLRAKLIRQETRNRWSANDSTLTTSEFARPHFSIGSGKLTLRQETDEDGTVRQHVAMNDMTIRVGDVPLFYWPHAAAEATNYPIRRITSRVSNNDGFQVKTQWDMFALANTEAPEGVELRGNFDWLGHRGPGVGVELIYEKPHMFGELEAYLVGIDHGEDDLGGRMPITHNGDARGFALWRHRHQLDDFWQMSIEVGSVSDETFLEDFFRKYSDTEKPFEASIYLKRQEDNTALTFLASYDINNFLAQTTTLQSPGYLVEKIPEVAHFEIGTPRWDNRLTYFMENRAGLIRINAGDDAPVDRGFTPAQSAALFGIPNTTAFDSALRAAGVPLDSRIRFDTRHEIQAPVTIGIFDVTSYGVIRGTFYDSDFRAFAGEGDEARGYGAIGVRMHTQFVRTFDDVENQTFDLHRLRHIIEPNIDVSLSGSTFNPEDIPVYDRSVEGITEGTTVRVGVRNTLQTKRGGPGRWRNVDWIIIDTDFILRSGDTDVMTELSHYYVYRPELTVGGDAFHGRLRWMVSDTFAVVGEITQNLERGSAAQWRAGGSIAHSPHFSSFVDYTEIDLLGSQLLVYGFNYILTSKYAMTFSHTLDFGGDESRNIQVALERKMPRWRMRLFVDFDELDDEQTIGILVLPEGLGSALSAPGF